ncbi:MAG: hypothetical protein ACT4PW_13300 [Acidimicrobiia bacterium]
MTITVATGASLRLLAAGERFVVQAEDASDVGAAIAALKLARVDILGLVPRLRRGDDPRARPSVSPVVNGPRGPMFLVERLRADDEALARVPDVVVGRLERAEVGSAVVDIPAPGGILDRLDRTPHAVVLRLFPAPFGRPSIPTGWLDIAGEWVVGGSDDVPARVRVLSIEYEVTAPDVSAVLHECGLARTWADAVAGDLSDVVRAASLTYGRMPHLALSAGGPNADSVSLLAHYALLQSVARTLTAELTYACIDFEPSFEGLALGLAPEGWETHGGAPPNQVAGQMLDERVPDAYPFQVLGPLHVRRLAGLELPVEQLGHGMVELSIEHSSSWSPSSVYRDDAQAEGWDLLRPLLVTAEEFAAGVPAGGPAPPPEPVLAEGDNAPDLASIVLEATPHSRRSTRLTVLELASWLAHEPHRDAPESVSPVVATFVRWWAAGLSDDVRQRLAPFAARMVGTAGTGADDDDGHDVDQARRWAATEWLVKVHACAWLDDAGLAEPATRLRALGPLTEELDLVRAVDALGNALAVASRRLAITSSIVRDAADESLPDEDLIWAAWERSSERAAWVASGEAAVHGADQDLVYATDLRVVECSRDPRARDEIAESGKSIGDVAWAAALHAVADDAWEQGWRAADQAARDISGFTLRIEMGRVAKSVLERGIEGEQTFIALDQAEQAGRDSLARAALRSGRHDEGEHPWDTACEAAAASAGGREWSIILDEARLRVGDDGLAQAMAEARDVTGPLLAAAPDTVARVVVAAVAREAASAAARGIAVRAAAVARANGAEDDATAQAAVAALTPTAVYLEHEAFALLDTLISPGAASPAAG